MPPFPSTLGDSWPGYGGIKKLFIFGNSYSAVGYGPRSTAPTEKEPLGVPFPGRTWTEGGDMDMGDSRNANWVGHLITLRRKENKSLFVCDYAVGGHTLSGLRQQKESWFLPNAGAKPDWALWGPEDSLFVTWIGINDCAYRSEHEDDIKKLFTLQEMLYENGARNFLLINVPPIHHSPAFRAPPPQLDRDNSYLNWNDELRKGAETFREEHPDVTLLLYSSWRIFNSVNENPEAYGFSKSDLKKAGGNIWMDHLHPTSRMHAILADVLDKFLKQDHKARAINVQSD